jgi:hypothetical protein
LCQKGDEIYASLFGPELMKNCVKKSMRLPHELTRIEGKLRENCVKKSMRLLQELTRIEGKLRENCVKKSMAFLHEYVWSRIDEKLCKKVSYVST